MRRMATWTQWEIGTVSTFNQDMCTACHGGNGSTMDKKLAHEGMVAQPLSDIYTDCHSCHPADYQEKSAQYASTLQETSGSCATPTPFPMNIVSGGELPGNMAIPSNIASAAFRQQPFVLIAGWLVILIFFFVGLVWLERHRVER